MQKPTFRSLLFSALCLIVLTAGALPAPAAELRWKLKPGESLHYVLEQDTVIRLKRGSTDVGTIKQSFTVDLTRSVRSVSDDGSAEMTQRFDRVRMKYDAGIAKIEYDSDKEPSPAVAPLVASLKAMVGAEFSFKMSSRGEMSDVTIPASVAKAFREAGSRGGSNDQFSEEGFKASLVKTSVTFPAEDLAPGTSWSRQLTVAAPDGGQVSQTRTYTYEGPTAESGPGLEKIGISSKLGDTTPRTGPLGEQLKSQECSGALYFDNTGGHMISSDVTEKTESNFTVQFPDKTESTPKVKGASIDQFIEQHTTMKLAPAKTK